MDIELRQIRDKNRSDLVCVSILVLMDIELRQSIISLALHTPDCVSILVLMDIELRQLKATPLSVQYIVSILVLMDIELRQHGVGVR